MAITKCKLLRSTQTGIANDKRTARRTYRLWYGTSNDAETYIAANLPTTVTLGGVDHFIDGIDLNSDDAAETVWTATLDYTTAPKKERSAIGDETVSFDLSSQTIKVTTSLSTVNAYAASGAAPDFKQGIGYDAKKGFQGADRFVETFSFSITKILANADITNTYIQKLRDTAFHWNDATFRGQSAGECLFIGAAGAPRDNESYSVAYKFLGSKNATGLTIGTITSIAKQGHDYLWALFEETEDTTAKFITPRPLAAYVERLYTSASFTTNLGLSA